MSTDVAVVLATALIVSVAYRIRPQPRRVVAVATAAPRVTFAAPFASRLPAQLRALWFARSRRRVERIVTRTYPDFVDLLILTVRAGLTPLQAFDALSGSASPPVSAALSAVVQRVARGDRFADALPELAVQLGANAQPLADALALCDRYGSPLAPILDRLADEARAQRRRNADAAARQLPIRLSFPLVGCTLPSFVLLTIVPLMAGTLSSLQGLRR